MYMTYQEAPNGRSNDGDADKQGDRTPEPAKGAPGNQAPVRKRRGLSDQSGPTEPYEQPDRGLQNQRPMTDERAAPPPP
jgi:hypothetical protein